MKKNGVSKIKHLSLRSKNEDKLQEDIIEDSVSIEEGDAIPETENSKDDFFSQTINFKTDSKEKIDSIEKAVESSDEIKYSSVEKNDISSTFYSSQKFVKEVSRVFKKTIIALVLDTIVFSAFVFAATNLFSNSGIEIGFWALGGLFALTVSVTTFFFIILSEKKFLYISIALKCVIYFAANLYIGQGVSLVTLIGVILVLLFTFLSYLELEKMQLGSRLFNLAIIAGEARKILVTLCIIIISIGVFNQIIFQGTENGDFVSAQNFVDTNILANDGFVESVLMGTDSRFRNYNLNSFAISRNLYFANGLLQNRRFDNFLLKDYLELVYNEPSVITADEEELFEDECNQNNIEDCDGYIADIYNTRLNNFKSDNYPSLSDSDLNSTIDFNLYKDLTKQYYSNLIQDSSKDVNTSNTTLSFISNLPFTNLFSAKYLIPIVMTVIVFVVLSIFRFIFTFITSIALSIVWNFMKLVRFVRVDIENVESEVVSI